MRNFTRLLVALAVGACLLGSARVAYSQASAAATTLTWVVTGDVRGLPGAPNPAPFECSVTAANPRCATPFGNLQIDFLGIDADSFAARLAASYVSGATNGQCSPLFVDNSALDQVDSLSCTTGRFLAASTDRGYYPCTEAFSGVAPSFQLRWSARATCSTTTTTTTTT